MAICDLCQKQKGKRRMDDPHESLSPVGDLRAYRGLPTGGYEDQDYVCNDCGSTFTHSNDKNDLGWIFTGEKEN